MGPPHPAAAEGARRGRSPPALGGCGGNGHPHEAAVGRRVCHVASLAQRRADRTQTLSNLNPSSALIYLGGARHLPFTSATIFQSPLARCFSFLGKFLFFSPSSLASFRSSYVKSAAVFRSLLQVAARPPAVLGPLGAIHVGRWTRARRRRRALLCVLSPAQVQLGARHRRGRTTETAATIRWPQQPLAASLGGAAGGYLPSSSETGKTESANPGKGAPARPPAREARCQPQSPGRRAGS